MENKTCSKCHEVKPVTCFHKSKRYKSGRRCECKSCGNFARREAYNKVHPKNNIPFSTRMKIAAKQAKLAKHGKDLVDLHEYRNDSITYDDAMHEINGY